MPAFPLRICCVENTLLVKFTEILFNFLITCVQTPLPSGKSEKDPLLRFSLRGGGSVHRLLSQNQEHHTPSLYPNLSWYAFDGQKVFSVTEAQSFPPISLTLRSDSMCRLVGYQFSNSFTTSHSILHCFECH